MGDEIENGGKLQKEHFCLVKKIGGQHWSFFFVRSSLLNNIRGHICHFVLLDQKSTPCTAYFKFLCKKPPLSLA